MNAIQGTYADFKIVKSRNVAQFIIEVPIEQANEAVTNFGLPDPHIEKWVAIAMLNQTVVERNQDAVTAIQRAGMLCKSEHFGRWLRDQRRLEQVNPDDEQSISNALRALLGVKSRSEFHSNQEALVAFNRLKGEYDQWAMLDNDN